MAPSRSKPARLNGPGAEYSDRQRALAALPFSEIKRLVPRHQRWMLEDIDYWDQLSPDDRVWMAAFLEQSIGARFRAGEKHLLNDAQRKEAQRDMRIKAFDRRGDALTFGRLVPYDEQHEDAHNVDD